VKSHEEFREFARRAHSALDRSHARHRGLLRLSCFKFASGPSGQYTHFYVSRLAALIWEIAIKQGRQLFWVFLYLWALLGSFSIYRSLILGESNIFYREGFAVINAWALAKAILIAERVGISDRLKSAPMVYPIVLKSALYAVLLMTVYFVEALIIGALRGETILMSVPGVADGTLRGALAIIVILFVVLLPFTALREIDRDLGGQILLRRTFHWR
jgi:hypothetical protein